MESNDIAVLMKNIADKIKTMIDGQLSKCGLTFQQGRIIAFLVKKGGTARQKEVEDFLCVTHATTRGIIKRLCEKGLVTIQSDNEGNHIIVSLTQKAYNDIRYFDFVKEKLSTLPQKAKLTVEEVKILTTSLEKINNALSIE